MADETLRGAQQRQAAAAAAAAQAQARADEAAAEMRRRVQAVTMEFLAEMRKRGDPGATPMAEYGAAWHLRQAFPPTSEDDAQPGVVLTTEGMWLRTAHNAAPVEISPVDCFERLLFSKSTREQELGKLERGGLPQFCMYAGRMVLLEHVDAQVLESAASLAANYFAVLLTRLPELDLRPLPELPPAPPLPAPRWWERSRRR